MPTALVVYSRPGCHLCEELIEALEPLVRGRAAIEVRDVDARAEWASAYGTKIPVVELDGRVLCVHRLDAARVNAALEAAG